MTYRETEFVLIEGFILADDLLATHLAWVVPLEPCGQHVAAMDAAQAFWTGRYEV